MTTTRQPLPPGINPVHINTLDQPRIASEVAIHRLPLPEAMAAEPPRWARERVFKRKADLSTNGRTPVAYSTDSRGRIVRGWYLNRYDTFKNDYAQRGAMVPGEGAWLDTLEVGQPSEPAYLHLRHEGARWPVPS